jgi:hypothetical protein
MDPFRGMIGCGGLKHRRHSIEIIGHPPSPLYVGDAAGEPVAATALREVHLTACPDKSLTDLG